MPTRTLAPLLLSLALAGPALAQEAAKEPAQPPAPPQAAPAPEVSLVDMVKALSKFLTEEEVELVYDYMWDVSIASLKGTPEEVTLPPELAFKLTILQARIVKEGGFYLDGLARRMEKDLQHWREEKLKPAPPVPYSLPSERNGGQPAKP
jgi:hypothetical protein